MSQVETQSRPQSGNKQSSPVSNGERPRGPKRQGSGNRPFDANRQQQSRGGDRPAGRGRGNGKPFNNNTKDSKTIYIGKVFTDDLDGSALSEKLKDQRIKYLREALESFGTIDSFEAPSGEGYVLASYETHEAAEQALKALKNEDEIDSILVRIREKLNQNKLPTAVLPNLLRYRYSWSDRQISSTRVLRGGKVVPNGPKTVIAGVGKKTESPSTPQQPTPQQSTTQAPKPKKERKPKQEEQAQPAQTQAPAPVQTQAPKQKKQAVQAPVASPKTPQGADDLQREAERARLSQDLIYLTQQQQHVSQELTAESDRCRARDERINRLSEELNRVRQQEQFLESQLKSEQKWKTDADERISKLTEEVTHFAQEQKQVEKRLAVVEQQLKSSGL